MTRLCLPLILLAAAPRESFSLDVFDRHTSYWVRQASKKSEPLQELSSRQAAELDSLGPGVTSPCVVLQTDQGNWTKALIAWGFRKAEPKPRPVLLIERFVTYDRDRPNIALARGRDVMLFAGFQYDFDVGQVVPEGLGGDATLTDTRRLATLGDVQLWGLDGSAIPGEDAPGEEYDPNAHSDVRPRDFEGTWRVDADGRWTGVWNLSVDDEGLIGGTYFSDETQSNYPIKGKITSTDPPHRITFDVEFAAANQSYVMYLWTSDKSTLAGTTTLLDRKFGVYARRETKPDTNKGRENR